MPKQWSVDIELQKYICASHKANTLPEPVEEDYTMHWQHSVNFVQKEYRGVPKYADNVED
eukprot:1099015-Amphidinium_carterae.1